jgi:hypothetical protein
MKIIGANVTGSFILNNQDVTTGIQNVNVMATTGSNTFKGNQVISGSLTVFTSGSVSQTNNGASYQSLVGSTPATSSAANKNIIYIGNNAAFSYNIYTYQSPGNVATLSGNGIVVENGFFTTAGEAARAIGNISSLFVQWSAGYLIVNSTYTGTAPTVYFAVQGISSTSMSLA